MDNSQNLSKTTCTPGFSSSSLTWISCDNLTIIEIADKIAYSIRTGKEVKAGNMFKNWKSGLNFSSQHPGYDLVSLSSLVMS